MNTRERLLLLLKENKGQFVSGEEIASSLSVSRTAVWKGVTALRQAGYEIDAVRNRGYRLSPVSDILSEDGIMICLDKESGADLHFAQTVTSTNNIVKELASEGAAEGYTLVAASQTKGKGRAGRSFYSPEDTGVYLSILLRPAYYDAARASRFTTIAAVAACDAIKECGIDGAGIKWVNDVYVEGRKVCGILTEASVDLESGFLDYAVLGIGFNAYVPDGGFPEEIRERAGAIFKEPVSDGKNRLAAAFINSFMKYYRQEKESGKDGEVPGYVSAYRERNIVPGKDIDVLTGGTARAARAIEIDDDCHLLVEYADGTRENLSAGEVSIRL